LGFGILTDTSRGTLMTKSDLVTALAARTDLAASKAEHIVNVIFDAMTEALVAGEGVELKGFGSFSVRHYHGYTGRNPRAGEPVEVAGEAAVLQGGQGAQGDGRPREDVGSASGRGSVLPQPDGSLDERAPWSGT